MESVTPFLLLLPPQRRLYLFVN